MGNLPRSLGLYPIFTTRPLNNMQCLILDEYQLMNEDTWEVVGAPMLLDNNGDAIFIYTPPSLHSVGTSKARDPRHAAKLFNKAKDLELSNKEESSRWATFHATSQDNPIISSSARGVNTNNHSH